MQSRGCAADDPIAARFPEPETGSTPTISALPAPAAHTLRVSPPWVEIEGLEQAAAASMSSWGAFEANLRVTVGRQHLAPSTVDGLHKALIAAGVALPWKVLNDAGRRGLRRKRVAHAECLAIQGIEPSVVLEAAYVITSRGLVEKPSDLGGYLVALLSEKDPDFIARSRERVATGRAALPMAAGADAVVRLTGAHRRLPGEFAYPDNWWRPFVPQQTIERIARIREMFAVLGEGCRVRDDEQSDDAAQAVLAELGAQRRQERLLQQERDRIAHQRRQIGRLIGAVQARDWRRVVRWLPPGTTAADAAALAGVAAIEVTAGIEAVLMERATA